MAKFAREGHFNPPDEKGILSIVSSSTYKLNTPALVIFVARAADLYGYMGHVAACSAAPLTTLVAKSQRDIQSLLLGLQSQKVALESEKVQLLQVLTELEAKACVQGEALATITKERTEVLKKTLHKPTILPAFDETIVVESRGDSPLISPSGSSSVSEASRAKQIPLRKLEDEAIAQFTPEDGGDAEHALNTPQLPVLSLTPCKTARTDDLQSRVEAEKSAARHRYAQCQAELAALRSEYNTEVEKTQTIRHQIRVLKDNLTNSLLSNKHQAHADEKHYQSEVSAAEQCHHPYMDTSLPLSDSTSSNLKPSMPTQQNTAEEKMELFRAEIKSYVAKARTEAKLRIPSNASEGDVCKTTVFCVGGSGLLADESAKATHRTRESSFLTKIAALENRICELEGTLDVICEPPSCEASIPDSSCLHLSRLPPHCEEVHQKLLHVTNQFEFCSLLCSICQHYVRSMHETKNPRMQAWIQTFQRQAAHLAAITSCEAPSLLQDVLTECCTAALHYNAANELWDAELDELMERCRSNLPFALKGVSISFLPRAAPSTYKGGGTLAPHPPHTAR